MYDSDLMYVLDSRNQLMKEDCCLLFLYAFIIDDMIEEFPSFHVFHDEQQLSGRLYDFIKLDDVGMPNKFQYMDLSRYSLDIRHFRDFAFLEDLDGDLLACGLMNR